MSELSGLFKAKYKLTGVDWVKRLDADDLRVFIDVGLQAAQHGHLGGAKRAATARRDIHGRFIRDLTLEELEQEEECILIRAKQYADDPLSWEPVEFKTEEQLMAEDIAWFHRYCPQV